MRIAAEVYISRSAVAITVWRVGIIVNPSILREKHKFFVLDRENNIVRVGCFIFTEVVPYWETIEDWKARQNRKGGRVDSAQQPT